MSGSHNGKITGILPFFTHRTIDKGLLRAVFNGAFADIPYFFKIGVISFQRAERIVKPPVSDNRRNMLYLHTVLRYYCGISECLIVILSARVLPLSQRPCLVTYTAAAHFISYLKRRIFGLFAVQNTNCLPCFSFRRYLYMSCYLLAKIIKISTSGQFFGMYRGFFSDRKRVDCGIMEYMVAGTQGCRFVLYVFKTAVIVFRE